MSFLLKGVFELTKIHYQIRKVYLSSSICFIFYIWSFQFTVSHRKITNPTMYFLKFMNICGFLFHIEDPHYNKRTWPHFSLQPLCRTNTDVIAIKIFLKSGLLQSNLWRLS